MQWLDGLVDGLHRLWRRLPLGLRVHPFTIEIGLLLTVLGVFGVTQDWPPWVYDGPYNLMENLSGVYITVGGALFTLAFLIVRKWARTLAFFAMWMLWSGTGALFVADIVFGDEPWWNHLLWFIQWVVLSLGLMRAAFIDPRLLFDEQDCPVEVEKDA